MRKAGSFIVDWWQLVYPYFISKDWRWAIPLLIGSVALTFGLVGFEKAFNEWNRRFYDAIQNKDEAGFWREIIFFSELAAVYIVALVARGVVSPYLRLRWRRWLTSQYLSVIKNSSLAVFIGYPDLVQVFAGTVLNQTQAAVQVMAITMGVYLAISVTLSLALNLYYSRQALE